MYSFIKSLEPIIGFILFEIFTRFCPSFPFQNAVNLDFKPFSKKPSLQKKIFDRFYRVDKARTRQTGGFGLGLSLAKQITEALKGTIAVKDNKPKGTIFEEIGRAHV